VVVVKGLWWDDDGCDVGDRLVMDDEKEVVEEGDVVEVRLVRRNGDCTPGNGKKRKWRTKLMYRKRRNGDVGVLWFEMGQAWIVVWWGIERRVCKKCDG
jgi:hypothetical protein